METTPFQKQIVIEIFDNLDHAPGRGADEIAAALNTDETSAAAAMSNMEDKGLLISEIINGNFRAYWLSDRGKKYAREIKRETEFPTVKLEIITTSAAIDRIKRQISAESSVTVNTYIQFMLCKAFEEAGGVISHAKIEIN